MVLQSAATIYIVVDEIRRLRAVLDEWLGFMIVGGAPKKKPFHH